MSILTNDVLIRPVLNVMIVLGDGAYRGTGYVMAHLSSAIQVVSPSRSASAHTDLHMFNQDTSLEGYNLSS